MLNGKWTWNGEPIRTSDYAMPYEWYATLDNYDPTPWDSETPARGPHSRVGTGPTEAQAICDLIEQLSEM